MPEPNPEVAVIDPADAAVAASRVAAPAPAPVAEQVAQQVVGEDLLVEDVSIDGMCGVY